MTNLIIGNIFCLFSMVTDSISAKKNTTKEILFYQSLSQVIYCTSSIILGGYSAAVQNVVTIIRNIIASQDKSNNLVEIILIILGIVLGFAFNTLGFIGFLPVFASAQYAIIIYFYKKNERFIKCSFAICCLCYTIFNFFVYNIVGGFTNFFVFLVAVHELLKK